MKHLFFWWNWNYIFLCQYYTQLRMWNIICMIFWYKTEFYLLRLGGISNEQYRISAFTSGCKYETPFVFLLEDRNMFQSDPEIDACIVNRHQEVLSFPSFLMFILIWPHRGSILPGINQNDIAHLVLKIAKIGSKTRPQNDESPIKMLVNLKSLWMLNVICLIYSLFYSKNEKGKNPHPSIFYV